MQALIVGLLLAGISATSVVAFKHPYGYARLFPYLLGIVTAAFLGITVWYIAVEISWQSLERYLHQDMRIEARIAKDALSLPYLWVLLWYSGTAAFLWVNLRLPPFLQDTDENNGSAGNGPS